MTRSGSKAKQLLKNPPSRARSLGVALFDQGSQSIVNLGLNIAVARRLEAEDFGAFSVTFVILTVLWGALRALVAEPFLVEHAALESAATGAQLRRCLLYTSPSPRDATLSRMPSSA